MANERHSYVEFYPSDWTGGTAYMPPLVEWLYLQVCIYNWDKREPLPKAQAQLRFSRSPSWQEDLELLLESGKVVRTNNGGLFVARAIAAANKSFGLWERKSRGGRNRQEQKNAGDAPVNGSSPDSTPPSTPASNQNQNQNQTPPLEENPPTPQPGDLLFEVPLDAMRDFREMRVKIGAPMTARAEEMIVNKLKAIWEKDGHAPADVLNQSTERGWRGVFPLKEDSNGSQSRGNRNGADNRDGFQRAIDQRLGLD